MLQLQLNLDLLLRRPAVVMHGDVFVHVLFNLPAPGNRRICLLLCAGRPPLKWRESTSRALQEVCKKGS